MSEHATPTEWLRPSERGVDQEIDIDLHPLVLVVEDSLTLTPRVGKLCNFLRVRVERVEADALLEFTIRERRPVGVLCYAHRTDQSIGLTLRAVVNADPALPILVVTDKDTARQARLNVAGDIVRLDNLLWLDHLPGARMLVEFLFMAERRAGRGGLMPI